MKLLSTYAYKHYIGIPEYRIYRSDAAIRLGSLHRRDALTDVGSWYRFDSSQWRKIEPYEDISNVYKW